LRDAEKAKEARVKIGRLEALITFIKDAVLDVCSRQTSSKISSDRPSAEYESPLGRGRGEAARNAIELETCQG